MSDLGIGNKKNFILLVPTGKLTTRNCLLEILENVAPIKKEEERKI